ncbi:hypothetical protein 7F23_56 [uncultured Caudovirales phage]|uniref:Uncharacterized protein n=1 Tax=uncultured Caudovirales phage TaxID=2100421 RepID=A0A2H4J3R8_9CAUD|nr:hypothetical protein 7F23_56 [uncultured Caudovirales phage]
MLVPIETKEIILKKGEICYLDIPAYVTSLKGINIFTDNGKLLVTNKRIVFIGKSRTITYQTNKILKFEILWDYERTEEILYIYKENQTKLEPICLGKNAGSVGIKEIINNVLRLY